MNISLNAIERMGYKKRNYQYVKIKLENSVSWKITRSNKGLIMSPVQNIKIESFLLNDRKI